MCLDFVVDFTKRGKRGGLGPRCPRIDEVRQECQAVQLVQHGIRHLVARNARQVARGSVLGVPAVNKLLDDGGGLNLNLQRQNTTGR